MATLLPQTNDKLEWKLYEGSDGFTGMVASLSWNVGALLFVSETGTVPTERKGIPLEPMEKIGVQIAEGEELYFMPMRAGLETEIILG